MKNNIVIIMLLMAVVFTGCQRDEDYDAPNSFSDVGWYFSDSEGNLAVSIDDYITFADLSQGVISHEWNIGSGSYYLEMPIARKDSVFDDKIIGAGKSKEKTVSVWFRKSGLQGVRLFNIFDDKVTFRGRSGTEDVFIDAEEIGGKWVIDTTFLVDVYDTIVPVIRIEQGGVVQNHTSPTDTIYVEAGATVDLFDISTIGRADTWEWKIGSEVSNDQNTSMVLKKLGVFSGVFVSSRSGNNIPGDSEWYKIPAPFKVIPSSQPFVIADDIRELEDQTIQVPYNGEFAPFLNHAQFFTVNVNGAPFDIATLSINADDATILDIKLVDQIYRDDTITVTYDGNGTFESTDTRVPEAFTDLPVSMFQHEIIKWDMEDGAINFTPEAGNLATTTIAGSTEQAASGIYSLKVDAGASGNWSAFENLVDEYTLEAGVLVQYEYKAYKLPGVALNFLAPWFSNSTSTITQFWHNELKNAPDETWVTIRPGKEFAIGATSNEIHTYFRHNGVGTIYLDDIRVIVVDKRP
jgi:hypothetical protein